MDNLIGIKGVIGIVILSVMSAFFIGGIIMGIFTSAPNQIDKVYLYLSFFLGQGVIILPPIYYLNFKKLSIINSLRIKRVSFNVIIYSILFSIGIIILFDALDRIIHQIVPTPDYIIDLGKIMQPDSTLGLIFLFLAVVIMAPIGEEIVFRGFLQKFLEEYWKDITRAVLITSLFFAMIHFNPYWTIQIYLLGIILGFLSWKTKSVIPSVILHSINNGVAFIFTVSDNYNFNFYLWGNYVSPFFIIAAIYLSYYSINNINQMKT
tara:strand:- start:1518 stop:2309 length:792 start_codon:yes stop_codon:yes gene_type:complete